jgi:transposase-like protein
MTAEKKIAQKRLTLLQVAEGIRNVSEACRRHSVSRSQFYEYKRAFQERGLDGSLKNPKVTSVLKHFFIFTLQTHHPLEEPHRLYNPHY